MTKKQKKDKKLRPKINTQIPISQIRKVTLTGPKYILQHAHEYPFLGCWVMQGWQENGITPVVVAREQSADKVTYGVYLIDLYCLGVKDVMTYTDVSRTAFQRKLPELCNSEPEPCSIEFAHEMIYGAIEYAKKYGLDPHPNFTSELADQILDPPDAHPRQGNISFGRDGKPFYVSGPHDDDKKKDRIIKTLMRTAGKGNFDYLLSIGDTGFLEE